MCQFCKLEKLVQFRHEAHFGQLDLIYKFMEIKKFSQYLSENTYNNVEISQSGGINCDNEECGWSDDNIPVSEYEKWVNSKCPDCGSILLTEEDYLRTKNLMNALNVINSINPDDIEKLAGNFSTDDVIDAYEILKKLGLKSMDDGKGTFEFK